MAVTLTGLVRQYVGYSADPKPTTVDGAGAMPAGSTFDELDTGLRWEFDGGTWRPILTDGALVAAAVRQLTQTVQLLHQTVEATRQGMIAVGNCDDVDPAGVQAEPVT